MKNFQEKKLNIIPHNVQFIYLFEFFKFLFTFSFFLIEQTIFHSPTFLNRTLSRTRLLNFQ